MWRGARSTVSWTARPIDDLPLWASTATKVPTSPFDVFGTTRLWLKFQREYLMSRAGL
jgi:hypothetical protein